jgi:hypothetical protein
MGRCRGHPAIGRRRAIKITINGETFDYDNTRMPMGDALAVEAVYGRRYIEWQMDLAGGSARAACALVWLIWKRDGRDVPFSSIADGTVSLDAEEVLVAIIEAGAEERKKDEETAPDPTIPGAGSAPDGTPSTGTATSEFSPSTSGSARGKSGSSKSRTSRPSSTS